MADVTSSDSALRRFLHGLPGVDAVGLEARAAMLSSRSIKTTAKAYAIDLAISMIDLTTLEGADTPGKVRRCAPRHPPGPDRPRHTARGGDLRVPGHGEDREGALQGTAISVASVATAFPAGRASLPVKLADTADAVRGGGRDRHGDRPGCVPVRPVSQRLRGDQGRQAGLRTPRRDRAHLKVIFENGELSTYDNIRRASWLAMLAGADFIKTSTGKVAVNATLPNTLLMLEAVRDFRESVGVKVG